MVAGGQAAIALIVLACCRAGSHVLVPDSAYRSTAQLASGLLAKFGVAVETYTAMVGGGVEAPADMSFPQGRSSKGGWKFALR